MVFCVFGNIQESVPEPHVVMNASDGSTFSAITNTANKFKISSNFHIHTSPPKGQVVTETSLLDNSSGYVLQCLQNSNILIQDIQNASNTPGTPSYTLMLVFKNINSIGATTDEFTHNKDRIMSFDEDNNNDNIYVKFNADNTINLNHGTRIGNGTYTTLGTSIHTFNDQEYNMLVMTRSRDRLIYKVFLNGCVIISHTLSDYTKVPVNQNASNPAQIYYQYARDLQSPRGLYFIYELKQWEETLTDSQISTLYASYKS